MAFFFEPICPLTLKKTEGGGAESIHWSGDRLPFLNGEVFDIQISLVYCPNHISSHCVILAHVLRPLANNLVQTE